MVVGNTAVCFSGGGSRAYVAALGQLEALRYLGLTDKISHIAGVSGGAWAAAVECWSEQNYKPPIMPPEELSWQALRTLPADAPHGAVCKKDLLVLLAQNLATGLPAYEAWRAAVYSTILQPIGLQADATLTSRGGKRMRPYPHLAAAVLGPANAAPFDATSRSFAPLDLTPRDIRFRGRRRKPEAVCAPSGGRAAYAAGKDSSSSSSDALFAPFTLADALATSSYFPSPLLSTRSRGALPLGEDAVEIIPFRNAPRAAAKQWSAELASKVRWFLGERWRCALPASALGGGAERYAAAGGGDGPPREQPSFGPFSKPWRPPWHPEPEPQKPPGPALLLGDGGACENLPLPHLLAIDENPIRRCLCCINVGEPLPPRA